MMFIITSQYNYWLDNQLHGAGLQVINDIHWEVEKTPLLLFNPKSQIRAHKILPLDPIPLNFIHSSIPNAVNFYLISVYILMYA
jgi:hypothetical protein